MYEPHDVFEPQGLTNFSVAHRQAAFSELSAEVLPLHVELACERIANANVRAVLAHTMGVSKAGDAAASAQRGVDVAEQIARAWRSEDVQSHMQAITIDGHVLSDWADGEAQTFNAHARASWGSAWPLRAVQEANRHAAGLASRISQGVADSVLHRQGSPWAILSKAPASLVASREFGAAYQACIHLCELIEAEEAAASEAKAEADSEMDATKAKGQEIVHHIHEVLSRVSGTPAQQTQQGGIWARLRDILSSDPVVAEAEHEDVARGNLYRSAISQAERHVEALFQACVRQQAFTLYRSALASIRASLQDYQENVSEALSVAGECARLSLSERRHIDQELLALGSSLNDHPSVRAHLQKLAGAFDAAAGARNWFGVLSIANDSLSLRSKRPSVAYQELRTQALAGVAQLRGMSVADILANISPDALSGIIDGLLLSAEGRVPCENGLEAAPRVNMILGLPGGVNEHSALLNAVRSHAMVAADVTLRPSPYSDSLVAVAEAHAITLPQLPGILTAYESYLALPEKDESGYDRHQAWADKRAHEIFERSCMTRASILEVIIYGLAFGKILDTKAQPGRKSANAPIKLVPDSEVDTAFDQGHGSLLVHMVSLGSSIPTLIESLATNPRYVREISDYVDRCVTSDGRGVVLQRLHELDRAKRYRKDPELTARLKAMLAGGDGNA